jgi:hypothetical protein
VHVGSASKIFSAANPALYIRHIVSEPRAEWDIMTVRSAFSASFGFFPFLSRAFVPPHGSLLRREASSDMYAAYPSHSPAAEDRPAFLPESARPFGSRSFVCCTASLFHDLFDPVNSASASDEAHGDVRHLHTLFLGLS